MITLNYKQFYEQMDEILDRFEAGDWTPVYVGKWGRPPYVVCIPYKMYEQLTNLEEVLNAGTDGTGSRDSHEDGAE